MKYGSEYPLMITITPILKVLSIDEMRILNER